MAFIDAHRKELGIEPICRELAVGDVRGRCRQAVGGLGRLTRLRAWQAGRVAPLAPDLGKSAEVRLADAQSLRVRASRSLRAVGDRSVFVEDSDATADFGPASRVDAGQVDAFHSLFLRCWGCRRFAGQNFGILRVPAGLPAGGRSLDGSESSSGYAGGEQEGR